MSGPRRVTHGERQLIVPRTCSVCGCYGAGRDWSRYSSIAADEGCGHEVVACSDRCRDQAAELVAAYDRTHSTGSCR